MGPIRKHTVVDFSNGESICDIAVMASAGTSYNWISDNEILYNSNMDVSPARPYGSGQGSGIKSMDITDCESQVVHAPTNTQDFTLYEYDEEENKIILGVTASQSDFQNPDDSQMNYYKSDLDGKNLERITANECKLCMVKEEIAKNVEGYLFSVEELNNRSDAYQAVVREDRNNSEYTDIYIFDFSSSEVEKFMLNR